MSFHACRDVFEGSHPVHLLVHEAGGDYQFLCGSVVHEWPFDRSELVPYPINDLLSRDPVVRVQLSVPRGWLVRLRPDGMWDNMPCDPENYRHVLPSTASADEMIAYLRVADINVDIGFMLELYRDNFAIRKSDVTVLERYLASDNIANRDSVLSALVAGAFDGYEADVVLLWFQSRGSEYAGRPVEHSPINMLGQLLERGSASAKRVHGLVAKSDTFKKLYGEDTE